MFTSESKIDTQSLVSVIMYVYFFVPRKQQATKTSNSESNEGRCFRKFTVYEW